MNKLGQLLKRLRVSKKLSLRDAAQRAGISHTYLSLLERGSDPRTGKPIRPSAHVLRAIAEAYNYPYRGLLDAAGYIEKLSGTPVVYVPVASLQDGTSGALERSAEYIPLPQSLATESCLALHITGDELVDIGLYSGDYVIVDPERDVESGRLGLVRMENRSYIRRIEKTISGITFTPPLPESGQVPQIVGPVTAHIKQNV